MTVTTSALSEDTQPAAIATSTVVRSRRTKALGIAVFLLGMIAVPWVVTEDKWMSIAVFTLIFAIGTLGIQVLMGYAGQVSLGNAAFMAIGATEPSGSTTTSGCRSGSGCRDRH